MMTNCGCREISHEPLEFKLQDCCHPQVYTNCGPLLPNENDIDLCKLQNKVICEFKDVIKQLECGIQPDIETILEDISLIFMNSCGYNIAKKMYSTDIEEDYFLRHNNFLSEFETQEEKDQVLLNLGIYDKINSMVTEDRLIEGLNTKIGFVAKVGKFYYGFASDAHYGLWIKTGNDDLVIGKWLAPDYIPNQYEITFINVGGDPVPSIQIFEGVFFTFPTPTNSDVQKHFLGWYSEYNFETGEYSGDLYQPGDKIIPTQGMVFYGKWVKEQRTLTFYPNYGTNTPIIVNSYLGERINLHEALTREGYRFLKWNTQSNGNGTSYDAGDPYIIDQDQSFYAQWQINQYTITFDFNYPTPGDNNIPLNQQVTLEYGANISFPQTDDIITSDGKIIKGWNINPNGTGNNPSTIPGHDITFYAQWEYGYKYKLATELPSEEPTWIISSTQEVTLANLYGWSEWRGQDNQYILLPKKVGRSTVADYINILDQFNQSIISDFEIDSENNIETVVAIKQSGFPLDTSDQNAKLIFNI